MDSGEAAVCYLAEVIEVTGGLVGIGGEQKRIDAAVIEAVALDDAAVIDGGDLFGGRVVAHQRAAGRADGGAAEVDLAVIGAYVAHILAVGAGIKLGVLVVHVRAVQGIYLGLRVGVGLIKGVVVVAELNGDAVVFKVCLIIGHREVGLRVVADSYGGNDEPCRNGGYLRAGGVLAALELVIFHAVHDAGGVQLFNRAQVIGLDARLVGDLEVAYRGGVLVVEQAAENVREVVAGDAGLVELTQLRAGVRQESVLGAVAVVGRVPVVAGLARVERTAVICRVDAGGNGHGVRPCDGLLRTEGAVRVADHDAPVVADLYAGVCPVIAHKIAVGVSAHVGDLLKCVQPAAGRGKGAERQKARKDKHERCKSCKLLHIMTSGRTAANAGYNSVSKMIISSCRRFCNRKM